MGPHEDAPHHVNDADCTEVDEQKKSGLDLFYLRGIYAIVELVREYKMGDQSGRPLCCVKDVNNLVLYNPLKNPAPSCRIVHLA